MLKKTIVLILPFLLCCQFKPYPPYASVEPDSIVIHGITLVDNYSWMKDKTRTNMEIRHLLLRENRYTNATLYPVRELRQEIQAEIINRIDVDDISVPVKIDDYFYYHAYKKGQQYRIYYRKKGSLDNPEEKYLDVNELALSKNFFDIYQIKVSPDHKYCAYSFDDTGNEYYSIAIKDLETGTYLTEIITGADEFCWTQDSQHLYYLAVDETGRTFRMYRHLLGSKPDGDSLVYQEDNPAYYLWLDKTKDRLYIILGSDSKTTSEIYLLSADNPLAEPLLFQKRIQNMKYQVFHQNEKFFINTNKDKAINYRLMTTTTTQTAYEYWQDFIPPRDSVIIQCDIFSNFITLIEKTKGTCQLRIIDDVTQDDYYLTLPGNFFKLEFTANPEYETRSIRFTYESFNVPLRTYEFNLDSKKLELQKEKIIPGYEDFSNYVLERRYAPGRDKVDIPISLLYNADKVSLSNPSPVLLEGYGAYGDGFSPYFSTSKLSILDRGIVYAVAHVRGGNDLGYQWYEQGRLLNKKNTFTDFIACAEFLIDQEITSSDELIIEGGSAGGLLIGAVLNDRPELFGAAIADVPFVDIINTMLDSTLSATITEYEEWGNPYIKEEFEYILSYCPYYNISAQSYPPVFIQAGYYDTRVNYWEPAKWIAKLRALKTDSNPILLYTDMWSGHSGASGRFDFYRDIAIKYAFMFFILEEQKKSAP